MKIDNNPIVNIFIGFLLGILFLAYVWWYSTKHQDKKEQLYNVQTFEIIKKDTNVHRATGYYWYKLQKAGCMICSDTLWVRDTKDLNVGYDKYNLNREK